MSNLLCDIKKIASEGFETSVSYFDRWLHIKNCDRSSFDLRSLKFVVQINNVFFPVNSFNLYPSEKDSNCNDYSDTVIIYSDKEVAGIESIYISPEEFWMKADRLMNNEIYPNFPMARVIIGFRMLTTNEVRPIAASYCSVLYPYYIIHASKFDLN